MRVDTEITEISNSPECFVAISLPTFLHNHNRERNWGGREGESIHTSVDSCLACCSESIWPQQGKESFEGTGYSGFGVLQFRTQTSRMTDFTENLQLLNFGIACINFLPPSVVHW